MNENENQKLLLKVQAMKESFALKVADYEKKMAEMRVDITLTVESLNRRIQELEEEKNAISEEEE